MHRAESCIRVKIATIFLVLGIGLQGIWFLVAFGFNGFPLAALPLVGSWALLTLSLAVFRRRPLGTIAASLLYLTVSVATFCCNGGIGLQDSHKFLYRHSVELMIVVAALFGLQRKSEGALYRYH
jgi:hypothetical protein